MKLKFRKRANEQDSNRINFLSRRELLQRLSVAEFNGSREIR